MPSNRLDRLIEEVRKINRKRNMRINPGREVQVFTALQRPLIASLLGFSMENYFRDPEYLLEKQLECKIYRHETFADDQIIDAGVGLDFGVALEASLFGCQTLFSPDADPAPGPAVVASIEDLKGFTYPDFYESGLMPEVHRLYRELNRLIAGRLTVCFPGFARGPWSVACMLRGFEGIYIDLLDNPQLVHRLMDLVTTTRMLWEKERSRFLGQDYRKRHFYKYIYADYRAPALSDLYNDEVDGNLFSLDMYRQFIYPYEKRLAKFYGQIRYYHSCGNLTPFLEILQTMTGLEMIHVSAATDLEKAVKILDPDKVIIQKVMHSHNDVISASEEGIRRQLSHILEITKGFRVYLCADAIGEGPVERVVRWLEIARETIKESGRNT